MRKVLLLQVVVTLSVAWLSWMCSGRDAAVSALLTGFACWVPNALFALNLFVFASGKATAGAVAFLAGEIIKLAATGMLLYLVVVLYGNFVWGAAIVTLIAVLNCSFLGLLIRE